MIQQVTSIESEPSPGWREHLPSAQAYFLSELEHVRKAEIWPMPNLANFLNHEGRLTKFTTTGLYEGFYLDRTLLPSIAEHGDPDRFDFAPQKMMQIGRENSRHSVFFGSLIMKWFNSGDEIRQQVAIKPTIEHSDPDNVRMALQEVAVNQFLEEEGVPALQTAGLLVVQGMVPEAPHIFTISPYKPVETMDNINWALLSPEDRWDRLDLALDTLVAIHSRLLFHGDPTFRNIAFGEVAGDIVIVDTEYAQSGQHLVHPSVEKGIDRIRQLMSADFSMLSQSVDYEILSRISAEDKKLSPEERFDLLIKHMYVPYYEKLVHSGSPYLNVLTSVLQEVINRKADEALGLS